MKNNPMSGGPHHVQALANAIERERRPEAHVHPPVTGGDQISVRLDETLLTHLDAIGKESGWTRVQVLTALIDRGLFGLYEVLSSETGEKIMDRLAPTVYSNSLLLKQIKRTARELLGNSCTVSPGRRPESFWMEGKRRRNGIPRMLIIVENDAADDFQNATDEQRSNTIEKLCGRIEKKWREALVHEYASGTEPGYVVLTVELNIRLC